MFLKLIRKIRNLNELDSLKNEVHVKENEIVRLNSIINNMRYEWCEERDLIEDKKSLIDLKVSYVLNGIDLDKCERIVRPLQNITMTELIMIHSKLNEVLKEKQYIYYMHFSHDKYYDCLCVNIDIEGKKREFTDKKPDIGDTTPITYNDQSTIAKCVIDAVNSTLVKEDGSISGKQIESIFNE